jgi:O-antigen ligase/tetratricopeptide (TPR) repeat protein
VAGLILIAPLALGSVEPWAFAILEATIFVLTGFWLLRPWLRRPDEVELAVNSYNLVLPAVLFLCLVGFQMVPIPPPVEAVISPSTFELYRKSLPGWPITSASDHIAAADYHPKVSIMLPNSAEVASGAEIPFLKVGTRKRSPFPTVEEGLVEKPGLTWRPLSVDSTLTGPALLKLVAYLCVFLLIVFCPFGEMGKPDLVRILLTVALIAGVLVGAVALLEHLSSDGRAIWLFAPRDWRRGNPWGSRATGPFANPDHLACYLNLVSPIALSGLLLPMAFVTRGRAVVRFFCAAALIVITVALLLTASRGAWLGALVGVVIFYSLSPLEARQQVKVGRARLGVWAICGLFVIVVFLGIGPAGRIQTDSRFEETVSQSSLMDRLVPAKLTLKMIGDFPALGIGLGCWPELFPQYANPPWSPTFWNAAHNDYIQLIAETGLLGFALLGCFVALVIRHISRGMGMMRPEAAVLVAACLAGISSVAVHECLDFALQIPANALLFTTLLAIAVRLTAHRRLQALDSNSGRNRLLCGIGLFAAFALFVVAIAQSKIPFPYNLKRPTNLVEAYALEDVHPANSRVHLMFAKMLDEEKLTKLRNQELQAALWLEPTNPLSRDLYAKSLFEASKNREAFGEIKHSVNDSPTLDSHVYLEPRLLPFLTPQEQAAVESGFGTAVAAHYEGALQNFAQYYDELGNFSAEGTLYLRAAKQEKSRVRRAAYFVDAGMKYVKARELKEAEVAFQAAALAAPQQSAAYEQRMLLALAQKNLAAARLTLARGIEAGADPFALYVALSSAAQMSGDNREADAALQKAAAIRPLSMGLLLRIGELDLTMGNFDRAAVWLRKATTVDPASAEAFYELGLADEGAYEYFSAEKDYQRALALAPTDERVSASYAHFRQKLERTKPR